MRAAKPTECPGRPFSSLRQTQCSCPSILLALLECIFSSFCLTELLLLTIYYCPQVQVRHLNTVQAKQVKNEWFSSPLKIDL